MLQLVATVLLTFQRFPITPGNSVRHERDMDAPVQPTGEIPMHTVSTRRALLAVVAAAVPALSLPAIASVTDPIFAAIELHRRASAAALAAEPCDEEAMNDLIEEESGVYADLLALTPTTKAGAAAVLLYVTTHENECAPWIDNWGDRYVTAGHDFLPRVAAVLQANA